jgi:hypothetical protein
MRQVRGPRCGHASALKTLIFSSTAVINKARARPAPCCFVPAQKLLFLHAI